MVSNFRFFLDHLFPVGNEFTPIRVLTVGLMVTIVVMLAFVLYKGWRREQAAIVRENKAVERDVSFDAFKKRVVTYFQEAHKQTQDTSEILNLVKVYLELARVKNSDANHAASDTKDLLKEHVEEVHVIAALAKENAKLAKEQTEELKTVIPAATVAELKKEASGDSVIIKVVKDAQSQ